MDKYAHVGSAIKEIEPFDGVENGAQYWFRRFVNPCDDMTLLPIGIPDGNTAQTYAFNRVFTVTISKDSLTTPDYSRGVFLYICGTPELFALLYYYGTDGSLRYLPIDDPVMTAQSGGSDPLQSWKGFVDQNNVIAHRMMYKGCTLEWAGNVLTETGTIIANQKPGMMIRVYDSQSGNIYIDNLHILPESVAAVSTMSNQAKTFRVRDGCYMPLRVTQPDIPFVQSAIYTTGSGSPTVSGVNTFGVDAGVGSFKGVVNKVSWCESNGFSDGVICLSGLSSTESWSFSLKCCYGLEMMLSASSPLVSGLKTPPYLDEYMLGAARRFVLELDIAYPSRYNDWNEIWKKFKSWYGDKMKPVVNAIGTVSPTVKGIAEVAHQLMGV